MVLDSRERLIATFKFKKDIVPPYWESLGFWNETIKRWQNEGLTQDVAPQEYFGMDYRIYVPEVSHFHLPYDPPFEYKFIAEDEKTITYLSKFGAILKEYKKNPEVSMPQWLEYPVKTREDFENIKFRLNPETNGRFPDWAAIRALHSNRSYPLGFMICGAYGFQRELLGVENLSYKYYDDPGLIEDIIKLWFNFEKALCEKVLSEINVDYIYIWEDMAYKNGPLISPAFFKQFILPYYKKLMDFIKNAGCKFIMVDSDGNNYSLLPFFIKSGVNCFMPIEVAAGMDPLKIRNLYGNKLMLWGGIDKRVLSGTKKDIEKEIFSKVPALLEGGGYIPGIDHSVPPDVSFENYSFFVGLLRSLTNKKAKK
jgi:hypothetical protein